MCSIEEESGPPGHDHDSKERREGERVERGWRHSNEVLETIERDRQERGSALK